MQFQEWSKIYILQVKIIQDHQHLLECVYFIKYLTNKVPKGRKQLLNMSDLIEILTVKN